MVVDDGDYVEKDQAIAEVDSDKATLELPAEASGIITLKAEEGDAVAVGASGLFNRYDAAKPEGSVTSKEEVKKEETPKAERRQPLASKESYATGTPSPAAKKILDEKGIDCQSSERYPEETVESPKRML